MLAFFGSYYVFTCYLHCLFSDARLFFHSPAEEDKQRQKKSTSGRSHTRKNCATSGGTAVADSSRSPYVPWKGLRVKLKQEERNEENMQLDQTATDSEKRSSVMIQIQK